MKSTQLPESVDGNRKAARQFEPAYVTNGEQGTCKSPPSHLRDPSAGRDFGKPGFAYRLVSRRACPNSPLVVCRTAKFGSIRFERSRSPEVKKRPQDWPPAMSMVEQAVQSCDVRAGTWFTGKSSRPPCGIGAQGGYFPQPFHTALQTQRVFQLTYPMTDDDERELQTELARLQQEHRDLDAAIDALHHSPAPDLLRLQRLKKRKLQLRDRISFIEDQITPDIIA